MVSSFLKLALAIVVRDVSMIVKFLGYPYTVSRLELCGTEGQHHGCAVAIPLLLFLLVVSFRCLGPGKERGRVFEAQM